MSHLPAKKRELKRTLLGILFDKIAIRGNIE